MNIQYNNDWLLQVMKDTLVSIVQLSFYISDFIPVALIVCSCFNYAQTVNSFVTDECYVPKWKLTVHFSYISALFSELLYFVTKLCIQLQEW